jgi:predicted Zn finger-like uncharacterized protein
MILTCPSCGTQYVVKDGAIPEGGRQVRCASCRHSWHQEPEQAEPVAATAPQEPEEAPSVAEHESDNASQDHLAEAGPDAAIEDPNTQDFASTNTSDEAPGQERGWFAPPEDEFAPFGQRDDVVEERGGRMLPRILGLILVVALLAVAFWFLAPTELKSRIGLAQSQSSPLELSLTRQEWGPLNSGNSLLTVSGRIINPTDETQKIPPIHAELRKKTGEVVYSWTISPPAQSLPPGGRAPFNAAKMNVPDGDLLLTMSFAAPNA